jgi:hypothetical protein
MSKRSRRWPLDQRVGPKKAAKATRGRPKPKKNDGPPRTYAKSQTYTYLPADFFPDFFGTARAFLGKGSSKTPQKYFCKSPCRKLFIKKSEENRCQFFLDFLGDLSRFRVYLSDGL